MILKKYIVKYSGVPQAIIESCGTSFIDPESGNEILIGCKVVKIFDNLYGLFHVAGTAIDVFSHYCFEICEPNDLLKEIL